MLQKEYYEEFNKAVNWLNLERYLNKRLKNFFNHIHLRKDEKILDIGCGRGFFYPSFQKYYKESRIIGIDFSFRQCSLARKNFSECKFIQSDVEKLPFRNKEFDVVFANALLHHILNVEQGINEMVRVCKSSGYVVIVEQNKFNPLIALLSLLKKSERNTFKLSISRIKVLLKKKTKKMKSYPINSYIYPYRSFPPEGLRKIVEKIEDFFEIPLLCTHYIIIAET